MNHGKLQTQIIGDHDRSLCSALIRRHHHALLPVRDVVGDPAAEERLHLQTVHWVVKESLQLRRVSIKHHEVVSSSFLNQISNQLGCDG